MNDLLVIAFPTEEKAEAVRQKLFQMQKEYLIEMGDAVVAALPPSRARVLSEGWSALEGAARECKALNVRNCQLMTEQQALMRLGDLALGDVHEHRGDLDHLAVLVAPDHAAPGQPASI